MEDQYLHILDDSRCLTRRQIFDYLENKLSTEERYVVECHLNDCPFCSDALEGFTAEQGNEQTTKHHLNELYHHFVHNQEDKPRKHKENPNSGWQKSSWYAAAAILVIAVGAFYLTGYIVKVTSPSNEIAQKQPPAPEPAAETSAPAQESNSLAKLKDADASSKMVADAKPKEKEKAPTLEKPQAPHALKPMAVINGNQRFADTAQELDVADMQLSKDQAAPEDLAKSNYAAEKLTMAAPPVTAASKKEARKDDSSETARAREEKAEPAGQLSQAQMEYEKGMNYYHKNDWKNAIINLSQVASKPNQLYYGAAKYYLAQSYKNAGDKLTATILLEQLAKENTPWKQAAQTALENIK